MLDEPDVYEANTDLVDTEEVPVHSEEVPVHAEEVPDPYAFEPRGCKSSF